MWRIEYVYSRPQFSIHHIKTFLHRSPRLPAHGPFAGYSNAFYFECAHFTPFDGPFRHLISTLPHYSLSEPCELWICQQMKRCTGRVFNLANARPALRLFLLKVQFLYGSLALPSSSSLSYQLLCRQFTSAPFWISYILLEIKSTLTWSFYLNSLSEI